MAALSRAESKHLYSWWWNSHISPKNSKWLQENLTDMDMKVKAMIKLIEEDADSFARRAEMYYKKRPELIKLVEEFYRAYRALAERYDHATGALHQAHQTMAEAFPNQIPELLSDESPGSFNEVDHRTPEVTRPVRAKIGSVHLHKDRSVFSSDAYLFKRNGAYYEEANSFSSKEGLKQSNEVLATAGSAEYETLQLKAKRNRGNIVENLHQEVSILSTENQNLKSQVMDVVERATKAENELESLKDTLSKLKSEKEADHIQYQDSLERSSCLESQLSNTQKDLKRPNEMLDEIHRLKDQKSKLEGEVGHHLREKEVVGQELFQLKEDKNDLEIRHQDLMEQLQAVSTASASLEEAIKNLEGACKTHEAENKLLLEKLKDMESISEKNMLLGNTLSDANAELEILRDKLSALESLHESLTYEKNSLVSKVEILAKNIEELSNKNTFLETMITDLNIELEHLNSRLAEVEELCQSLNNQNSALLAEKNTLSAQVESVTIKLESLKIELKELQDQCSRLSIERDLFIDRVKELQQLLEQQKREDQDLSVSYKTQIATLENQIGILQEQNQLKETELEAEKAHLFAAMVETFVFQASLFDAHKSNLILSLECKKHLEAHRNAEIFISLKKQEELIHLRNIMLLTKSNEKLSNKIRTLSNTLFSNKELGFVDAMPVDILLDYIIVKIEELLNSVSDAGFDIQQLNLHISILVTLLKQIALDMANLKSEKFSFEKQLEIKANKVLSLEDKQHALLQLSEKLAKNVKASNQREEVLEGEVEIQNMQLSKIQEALQKSESETYKLGEANKTVSEELFKLRQKHDGLLEEHEEVLAELINLDNLHTFYKNASAEKLLKLESFNRELISLISQKDGVESEVNRLNAYVGLLEAENMQLLNLYGYLQEELINCLLNQEFDFNTMKIAFEDLDLESEKTKSQLMLITTQLSVANQKIESTRDKNKELLELLESLYMENEEAKLVKEELIKSTLNLSDTVVHRNEEISNLQKGNEMLQNVIYQLHRKVELDLASLFSELHFSTVHASIYEEKVNELTVEGDVRSQVEKAFISKQLGYLKSHMDELKKKHGDLMNEKRDMKAELNSYLLLLTSLWNGIASLENEIMPMPTSRPLSKQVEEVSSESYWNHANRSIEEHKSDNIVGPIELEKLIDKVEAIGRVLVDRKKLLEQDSNTNPNAANDEKEPKVKTFAEQMVRQLNVLDDEGRDKTQRFKEEGQMLKDIELDQVSSSLPHNYSSYKQYNNTFTEMDDHLLVAAESQSKNHMHKAPSLAIEHELEAVNEEKREPSSELIVEEELSVDKLEICSMDLASERSWHVKLLERLESESQRLADLKMSISRLKSRMEISEMEKLPMSYGYGTIKAQLKEAEVNVSELIDVNIILTNRAGDYASWGAIDMKSKEISNAKRRAVSEQVKRESLKVERLQFELQKIQYMFLKLEEEQESRSSKGNEKKTRVLLRDYFYGRRGSPVQTRKRPIIGCIRAKVIGD